jgi:Tfp pilus assembly protein PilX
MVRKGKFLRRRSRRRPRSTRAGNTVVVVMVFLVLFGSMSLAFQAATTLNLAQSGNFRSQQTARLAAECGLAFHVNTLVDLGISGGLRGKALLDTAASSLQTKLDGTHNLQSKTVAYDGNTITIPSITLGSGQSCTATLTMKDPNTLHLAVTGQYSSGTGSSITTTQRRLGIDLHPNWDETLSFGVCSLGPVTFGMNTTIVGATDPADGSIYSASPGLAVSCGSGHISGDVAVSAPGATASLAGTTVDGGVFYNAPPMAMPFIDRTAYKALATNIMNSPTPPGGTYTNIRIPANTNPTFSNAVTIQGVMYVQSPNKIYFNNNCAFTGILVADDQAPNSGDANNYIYYKNNMSFNDVNQLPSNDANFTAVRQLEGVSILAPGFTLECKNNLTSVAGIVALKALTAMNNLDATFDGSVLIYGSGGLTFKNNTDLGVNLSESGHGMLPLTADPNSYAEY